MSRGDDKITPDDAIVDTLLHFSMSLHKHFSNGLSNKTPAESLKVQLQTEYLNFFK